MKKSLITAFILCIVFTTTHLTQAFDSSSFQETDYPEKKINLGIQFGFGCPMAWAHKPHEYSYGNKYMKAMPLNASPNFSFGIACGYNFYLRTVYKAFKFGPELGINYCFTRKVDNFEEKYMSIPLVIRYLRYEDVIDFTYIAYGLDFGYEFIIPFATNLNSQVLETVPTALGNIVLGGKLYLSNFYLGARFKFPLEFFVVEKTSDSLAKAVMAYRQLCTSVVELYLGVDVMKYFNSI